MANLLIIGAGGVSRVATIKCAMNQEVFDKITLASRTKRKCDEIASFIKQRLNVNIHTAEIDADDSEAVVELIKKSGAEILLNLALPYQDLTLMDACIRAKIHYIDTANYEHPSLAKFEYKEQWARNESFKDAGILVLQMFFVPMPSKIYLMKFILLIYLIAMQVITDMPLQRILIPKSTLEKFLQKADIGKKVGG